MRSLSEFEPFVDGLDHPECVTCDSAGVVYAGGEAGQIYRVSLNGSYEQVGSTEGFVLGICLDGAGDVYACDSARRAVIRVRSSDGASSVYSDGDGFRQMVNPNYPVFDAAGNLYVSDSGTYNRNDGCLWVIPPGGGAAQLLSSDVTAFPNGLALDPDGAHLHVVVSQLPGVVRIPVAGGRAAGPVEEVVRLPERHVPDGIAFDAHGALYISCYTPDVIFRFSANGLEKLAEDWERAILAAPTNIAFCGPDRRTLVVASLGRWHLTKAKMPVAGAPYNYPTLP